MAYTLNTEVKDGFEKALQSAVQTRINEIIEDECKSVSKRVTQRVREEVGLIAARVLQRFTMQRFGETELVIRVDISDEKTS